MEQSQKNHSCHRINQVNELTGGSTHLRKRCETHRKADRLLAVDLAELLEQKVRVIHVIGDPRGKH